MVSGPMDFTRAPLWDSPPGPLLDDQGRPVPTSRWRDKTVLLVFLRWLG